MPQTIQPIAVPQVTAVPTMPPSRKIVIVGASGLALIAGSLFAYQVYAAASGADTAGGAGTPAVQGILASTPDVTHEMTIGNNGIVYLQNATLEGISGNIATIESSWGAASFTWRGEVTTTTKVFQSDGSPAAITDLSNGQMVTVTGHIDMSSPNPAIKIQYIRE